MTKYASPPGAYVLRKEQCPKCASNGRDNSR